MRITENLKIKNLVKNYRLAKSRIDVNATTNILKEGLRKIA